ncbi:MAG TPA: WYL domain-containing protein [Gaiellales bacterium]|nr:WYL domain-containing protein [Gaiellales bacterium]
MTHDADKLIRQLSLVAYLMAEQRPVTARDVKTRVEGYSDMGDEAFARRYYADRRELQDLGVPIASGRDEFTSEELYSLREEQYFLPPIELTDDELAALQTSFYLLEGQFAYAEPLRLALQNLALGRAWPGADPGPKPARVELLAPLYTDEIAARLAKLEQAISKQRTLRFRYWTISTDTEGERTVNPYGLWEMNGVWYVVGDDLDRDDPADRRRTFRVSRIRGEIKFATRRERDFRIPADFDVNAYRNRPPWKLSADEAGAAVIAVTADATWLVERGFGAFGEFEELGDGSGRFTTAYDDAAALSAWILSLGGRARPLEPEALIDAVSADLEAVIEAHTGAARDIPDPAPEPAAGAGDGSGGPRTPGPVAPERFALLQALLAFLLARCGDAPSARVEADEIQRRFRLSPQELQESLDLLNLVNFGGGCYAVYCATENGHVLVDKELYGDTFRRPARLSPLEAKALLRALDVVAPLVAAEAHTTLTAVRQKVEAAFGSYALADTPAPKGTDAEEHTVTILNEGVRTRRLVEITYLSRSSDEFSSRLVEPYLLRRDDRGWYVETWDTSRDGRRTFKVSYIKDARLTQERYEPRPDMADLDHSLGGKVGIARIWFAPERARWELEGRPGARPAADGAAVADVTYGSQEWLVSEILRYRGQAEVLEPAAVRAHVRRSAQRLLRAFRGAAALR